MEWSDVLGDLERVVRDLPRLDARPVSGASDGPSGGKPGSRPPARLEVLDLLDVRTSPVAQLARDVVSARLLAREPETVLEAAQLLLRHEMWASVTPVYRERYALVSRTASRSIGRALGVVPVVLARCPECERGRLSWTGTGASCGECEAYWPRETILEHVSEVDVWLPTGDVERLSGVPKSTLSLWVRKGKVRSAGRGVLSLSDAVRVNAKRQDGARPTMTIMDEGLPLHRTEAGWPNCSTCDGGGCYDCTEPA